MQVPKYYVLTLAPAEAAAVRRALGTLPYDTIRKLIESIDGQVAQQNEAAAASRRAPGYFFRPAATTTAE